VLFKSLWKRLLRVGDRVVIEGVAEEAREDGGRWWSCRCGCAGAARNAGSAAAVDGYRRVTTPGRVGAGGGAWIRA
jgi:hypothetical protein